uniref:Uncharacterized protein LOC105051598 n=1 Tax=Elaeis guineensis var. tenera TaxID=51953 RepID=A0A6I9RYK2_ELAGV|nr:uncharacterized protein LOC105051598 [Elaeis guineensis]
MRREGRQHGLVITCSLPDTHPKPKSRVLNRLDGPPTAGVYTKVPTKPTNHSKFTGRCSKTMWASCHFRPAYKSKDKAKGNHKLKSSAMDSGGKLWFNGVSATRVLDHLYEDNWTIESDGDAEYASNDEGLDEEKHGPSTEESRVRLVNDDGIGLDRIRPEMMKEDDVNEDWVLVEGCEL